MAEFRAEQDRLMEAMMKRFDDLVVQQVKNHSTGEDHDSHIEDPGEDYVARSLQTRATLIDDWRFLRLMARMQAAGWFRLIASFACRAFQ